jgi:hypothetical protein
MYEGVQTLNEDPCLEERRRARRYRVGWQVRVVGVDSSARLFDELTHLHDISVGGAYAYFSTAIQVGSRVSVTIKLPSMIETWMSYTATAVRVDTGFQVNGVGLQFDSNRPEFKRYCSS